MRTLAELKQAISEKKVLVWNDPDPIKENDYTINFIEDIDDELMEDSGVEDVDYDGGSFKDYDSIYESIAKTLDEITNKKY